ncbi:hypothetical protein MKUB_48200 [Mycobacterium kubicae]|uniref:EcsC family protein n=1 Tax=Mycobacterium kubicae TaxID=120959 RepID=A0AAX1J8H4_9MYCO|nr:hypothetical protein [Mycobacterium kubicae]MCV7096506.1 hypothetical protein [Mycobacterium kubicae]OBF20862.1 hypothetical protein A5725_15165 [Mycobacterium kubicae]OBK54526.1 hypothetical protein A5657_13050 [Mycobacterium kubicae]ORW01850.1 hypothetical protein AWC13_06305 [Mycobacterium kubicae]QNI08116.1 hypothetical protein GAN17_18965 [Mycobacterium kubicae]
MSAWRRKKQLDQQPMEGTGRGKLSSRALAQVLERSSHIQGPAAEAYVTRLRRSQPEASPAQIAAKLEKRFVHAVTVSGAAVGATATLPGIGTLAALSAAAGETAVFLEATAVFVLALASVYGIPLDNRERRRALVLAVLVGDNSKGAVAELVGSGRTKGGWVSESMASLPLPALSKFNQRMLKYFVKRFALKRGALMFGKLMPVGIGAIIGAIGNRMVGKRLVRNARSAFGPPPARWPVTLHLLPPIQDAS